MRRAAFALLTLALASTLAVGVVSPAEADEQVPAAAMSDGVFDIVVPSWDKMEYYHPGVTGHDREGTEIFRVLPAPTILEKVRAARLLGHSAPVPYAGLAPAATTVPGAPITLDASSSIADATDETITGYEWDFDGDGTYDVTTTTPTVAHAYDAPASIDARVRVTRTDGTSAVATVHVDVTRDGDTVPDELDLCPDVADSGNADTDADGRGDACDSTPGVPTTEQPGTYAADPNGLLVNGGTVDPSTLRPDTPGTSLIATTDASGRLVIDASGLPVNSEVGVWITSPATRIALLRTDSTGRLTATVDLPAGVSAGGQTVALAVEPELAFVSTRVSAPTLAATGFDGGVGSAGALLMLLGMVMLSTRVRARRA